MRKELLYLLALIPLTVAASAQIRIGLKGGPNYSNVSQSTRGRVGSSYSLNFSEKKPDLSYFGGITASVKLGTAFSLRPSILYKNKKWHQYSYLTSTAFWFGHSIYEIRYVEVPLHFIYSAPIGNGKLYIGTGPYFSYGLNGKLQTRLTATGPVDNYKIVFDKNALVRYDINFNRIDYGLSSIMGYEFLFGLLVDIGYDVGLRKVLVAPSRFDPEPKYNAFNLSAAYLINFKRK